MKDEKRRVRNTAQEAKENPLLILGLAMAQGTSNMIEAQEAEGQSSFVTSTTLPTRIMTDKGKEIMESLGVVFGDEVDGDPLFQYVELPEGWKRESTDHSMHSNVLDNQGRIRIQVFYKAAFYDRSAHMWLSKRYGYSYDYDRKQETGFYVGIVTDCDAVIYEAEPLPSKKPDGAENWDNYDKCQALAKEWLDANYPAWQDPAAYWE